MLSFAAVVSPCAPQSTQIYALFATSNPFMQLKNCTAHWKCRWFRWYHQSYWHSRGGLSNAVTTSATWPRQWTIIQGKILALGKSHLPKTLMTKFMKSNLKITVCLCVLGSICLDIRFIRSFSSPTSITTKTRRGCLIIR